VIEFFSRGVNEPNAEVAAMFATVGGQLAQYLERPATRRWLDAAEVPLVALDATGRVLLANRSACELVGRSERELLGTDWAEAAVPEAERSAVRAALGNGGRVEHVVATPDGARLVSWQLAPLTGGAGTWATGAVRPLPPAPVLRHEPTLRSRPLLAALAAWWRRRTAPR
jgi:PAS domain S-box-containing protein